MGDILGLKKYSQPSDPESNDDGSRSGKPAPETAPPHPRFNLPPAVWMVFLVVDALLIAIFGSYLGVAGMRAYQQSQRRPAAPAAVPAKPKAPAKEEPAKTEAPAPAAPSQAKETPAPAASSAKAAPKPQDQPKPAPKAPAVEKPAPAADAEANVKALPVDFSFHAPSAKSVRLAGAFLVRGGGKKDMVRGNGGDWTLTLFLKPGSYRYWFLEDGKKKIDPANSKIERGASVVVVYPR